MVSYSFTSSTDLAVAGIYGTAVFFIRLAFLGVDVNFNLISGEFVSGLGAKKQGNE
jgi:hypothetical protein